MQLLVRGEVAALPLEGVIDLAAERTRLEKEMAKVDADIKRVDAKLGNADFVARAPEEVSRGRAREARGGGRPPRQDHRGAGADGAGDLTPARSRAMAEQPLTYTPGIFDQDTIEGAKNIILTVRPRSRTSSARAPPSRPST